MGFPAKSFSNYNPAHSSRDEINVKIRNLCQKFRIRTLCAAAKSAEVRNGGRQLDRGRGAPGRGGGGAVVVGGCEFWSCQMMSTNGTGNDGTRGREEEETVIVEAGS